MGLLDALQAASNSAASNVSAPVDGIAWILRKLGVPIPAAPVGGSDWMKAQGLTRDVRQSPSQLAGETAGLLSPVVAAAKAPQIAAGLLKVADNAAAPRTLNPQTGAIVWHGSPHKFDRFDSSKIGTGEGAQAYGHGLYFAESPDVAKSYKDVLSSGKNARFEGKGYKIVADDAFRGFEVHSDNIADDFRGGVAVSEKLKDGFNSLFDALQYVKNASGADELKFFDGDRFALRGPLTPDELLAGEVLRATPAGSLYKVDLPDPVIAKMLDWDKPLSQQAPALNAMRTLQSEVGDLYPGLSDALQPFELGSTTGQTVYHMLQRADGGPDKAARTLRALGVPGIRYLDGGSRGAGSGTSNFVVFPGEENILSILERNGVPLR